MQIEHIDGFAIPTVKERGTRRAPADPNPALAAAAVLKALEPGRRPVLGTALFNLAAQLTAREFECTGPFHTLGRTRGKQAMRRAREIQAGLEELTDEALRVFCTGLGAVAYITPPAS